MIEKVSAAVQERPPERAGTPEHVLRVLGLEKSYRTGFWRRPHPALRGVSFVVPRGTVFALLGHNGAGKTTTMRAILDLVHPDAGVIEVLGRDHRDLRCRARVGYLPENPYFYEHLTGRELLDFYGRLFGMPAARRRRRMAETLEQVGMTRHAGLKVRKYSKGMLQRIGLAQALLNEPELLVLDEPMSGLDPLGRRQVRELLRQMKQDGATILLSSHIVPDVEALADSVAILADGHLQAVHDLTGSPDSIAFEVTLAGPPPPEGATEQAGRGGRPEGERGRERTVLSVPGPAQLAALLSRCTDHRIPVLSVETRRTGLEELFLTALDGRATGGGAP